MHRTNKLLVLDTSYTFEMIQERELIEAITCRDLDGFFTHVWSVHPYATVIPPLNKKVKTNGSLESFPLGERHTIIEGKVGRYEKLKDFPSLNFFLSQLFLCRHLNQIVKKEKCTVVRAGDPYYLGLMGLLLARINGIPLVVRIGSNYDKCYEETGKPAMPRLFKKRWIEKIVERFVLKRADLIAGANLDNLNFAINNSARKEFTTLFRYGNLVHQSHRVPPDERPSADGILSDLGLADHQFVIYIGRLEPVKMLDHVIMTIAEIKKRGYDLKVLIIGDGSMKEYLLKMAQDLDITEDIIFAGNKNQQWIVGVLPHATVALSPHTGRALAEAALGGVPIVAYDIDWQSELIKTGETGELVEYRNWSAMADSTVKLLKDSKYAKRMGTNARNTVLEMMDPVKLNQHERNEYDKLFERYFSN